MRGKSKLRGIIVSLALSVMLCTGMTTTSIFAEAGNKVDYGNGVNITSHSQNGGQTWNVLGEKLKTNPDEKTYTVGMGVVSNERGLVANSTRDVYVRASVKSSAVEGADDTVLIEFVNLNNDQVLDSMEIKEGETDKATPSVTVGDTTYNFGVATYDGAVLTIHNASDNGNYTDSKGKVFSVISITPSKHTTYVNAFGIHASATSGSDTSFSFIIPKLATIKTTHEFYDQDDNLVEDMTEEYTDVARSGDKFQTIDKHKTDDFKDENKGKLFESIENGPTGTLQAKAVVGEPMLYGVVNATSDNNSAYEIRRYLIPTNEDGDANIEIRIFVYETGKETTIFKTVEPVKPGKYNTIEKNAISNPEHPYQPLVDQNSADLVRLNPGNPGYQIRSLTPSEGAGHFQPASENYAAGSLWWNPDRALNTHLNNNLSPVSPNTIIKYKLSDVKVHYVNTKGETIKDSVYDTQNVLGGEGRKVTYDTSDKKEKTIEKDGKLYVPVTKADSEGSLKWDDNAVADGSDPESTELPYNTVQNVTYVYEEVPAGKVIVHYINEDGETIKDDVVDTPLSPVGTEYDTAVDNKPTAITKDGVTYYYKEIKDGSEAEKGEVEEGTKEITYVYRKTANWIPHIPGKDDPSEDKVKYPDPEDPTKEDPNKPTVPTKENPNDPNNPPVIPYVPGYEPEDPLDPVDPDDPTKGYIPPTPEDPFEDTHIYYKENPDPKTGKVIVRYENEQGEKIKDEVEDTPESPVGTDYDTTDNKPKEITKDGKTYEYVKVKEDSEDENGTVKEGETIVTYVYKLKEEEPEPEPTKYGKVIVHYVNEDGETIKDDVVDTEKAPVNDPYDTTDNKPETIDKDGTTYYYKEIHSSSEPENGTVKEGTTEITYVYSVNKPDVVEETGSVIVHYENEDGETIKDDVVDTSNAPVGDSYDTTDNKPKEIEKNGKTYEYVKVKEGSEPENGNVKKGLTEVTYVYKLKETPKGSVTVRYEDEDGNEIKDPVKDVENDDVDNPYDTTDNKPKEITKDGKTYEYVKVKEGSEPENGKVKEGETVVTYVYKEKVVADDPTDPTGNGDNDNGGNGNDNGDNDNDKNKNKKSNNHRSGVKDRATGTGDSTNLFPIIIVCLMSLLSACGVVLYGFRRRVR